MTATAIAPHGEWTVSTLKAHYDALHGKEATSDAKAALRLARERLVTYMNGPRFGVYGATLILLALPVAQFVRTGTVSSTLVGALLVLVFGGSFAVAGFKSDKTITNIERKERRDDDA